MGDKNKQAETTKKDRKRGPGTVTVISGHFIHGATIIQNEPTAWPSKKEDSTSTKTRQSN